MGTVVLKRAGDRPAWFANASKIRFRGACVGFAGARLLSPDAGAGSSIGRAADF